MSSKRTYIAVAVLLVCSGIAAWLVVYGAKSDPHQRQLASSTTREEKAISNPDGDSDVVNPAEPVEEEDRVPDTEPADAGLARVTGVVRHADSGLPITVFQVAFLPTVPQGRAQWRGILGSRGPNAGLFGSPKVRWIDVTSADGRFALEDIPPGNPFAVAAAAEGYEAAYVPVQPIEASSTRNDIIISLTSETGIQGTVSTPDGDPIPAAAIRLGDTMAGHIIARTDTDGAFRAVDLAETSVTLQVEHSEFLPTTVQVTLQPHAMVEVPVILHRGGTVSGSVTIGADASSGASVTVVDTQGFVRTATTNGQGRYAVSGIPPGQIEVHVQAPAREGEAPWTLQRDAVVASNLETIVNIQFPGFLGSVSGRVSVLVEPVAGGLIRVQRFSDDGDMTSGTQIGTDGTYLISNLPDGLIRLTVMIQTENRMQRSRTLELNLAEGEHQIQDIAFDASGSVDVSIANLPVDAHVSVALVAGTQKINLDDPLQRRDLDARTVARTSVSGSGYVVLDGIEPGTYILAVIHVDDLQRGQGSASIQQVPVTVEDGKTTAIAVDFPPTER